MTSDRETTESKVVDLKELYNYVVDHFFYLELFIQEKSSLNYLKF
jgi:hypothetical protein